MTDDAPWSIVSSAGSNSALAGLLAGLLVATITVMISRDETRELGTIGLFAAAMVALALDSYLFSYLTGIGSTGMEVCAKAWVQGMAASGVLVVGGVAVINGIAAMLVLHLMKIEDRDRLVTGALPFGEKDPKATTVTLAAAMAVVVMAATTLLLSLAFVQYVRFMQPELNDALIIVPFSIAAIVVAYCARVIFRRTNSFRSPIQNEVYINAESRQLGLTAVCVAFYALLASAYSGCMILTTDFAAGWAGMLVTYLITVAVPAAITIQAAHAVPKHS